MIRGAVDCLAFWLISVAIVTALYWCARKF